MSTISKRQTPCTIFSTVHTSKTLVIFAANKWQHVIVVERSKTYRGIVNNVRIQLVCGRVYERSVFLDRPWTGKPKHTDAICLRRNKKQKDRKKYFFYWSLVNAGLGEESNNQPHCGESSWKNTANRRISVGVRRSQYIFKFILPNTGGMTHYPTVKLGFTRIYAKPIITVGDGFRVLILYLFLLPWYGYKFCLQRTQLLVYGGIHRRNFNAIKLF